MPEKKYQSTLLAAALVLGALFALYLSIGFFLEEYETLNNAIVLGQALAPPLDQWIHNSHFLTIPLVARIGIWFPDFPAYGVYSVLLNFLWAFALLQLIFTCNRNQGMDFRSALPAIALTVILVMDSLIQVNLSRSGALLAISALALSHVANKAKVSHLALFALGVLTRMHVAFIVFAVFVFWLIIQRRPPGEILRRYFAHALLLGICLGTFHLDRIMAPNQGKIIESRFEYAIADKNALVPLGEMPTKRDSIKYIAVSAMMLTDSAEIDVDFLSSVVVSQRRTTDLANPGAWVPALFTAFSVAVRYLPALLALYGFMGLVLFFSDRRRQLAGHLALLHGVFWLLIFLLSVSVNMFPRFFSPMLAVTGLLSLMLLYRELPAMPARIKTGMLAGLSILLVWQGLQFYKDTAVHRESNRALTHTAEQFTAFADKSVFVLGYDERMFTKDPFRRLSGDVYDHVLFTDFGFLTYFDFAQKKVIDRCGFSPLDYPAYCAYILDNREDVLFYSPVPEMDFRLELFRVYQNTVHDCAFQTAPIPPTSGQQGTFFSVANPG